MSDDLISRKVLIEQLEKFCGKHRYLIPEIVWEIIENAPAAFDKERVIEELRSEIHLTVYDPMISGRYIKKSRAIEIVEKGGVD